MAWFRRVDVHGDFNARHIKVKEATADVTLTEFDSGKVILISANGIDVTLPAVPTMGMNYKLIMRADYSTAVCTVTCNGSGEFFAGSCATGADGTAAAIFDGSTHDVCTFGAASLAGDYIEVFTDGTLWFITGTSAAAAGIAVGTS
jgi:hypothetical protein